jgi:hypothetical protein
MLEHPSLQFSGSLSGSLEIKFDGVFLGEISEISRRWARSDRIGSWFELAFDIPGSQSSHNSCYPLPKGESGTDPSQGSILRHDIAYKIKNDLR